MLPTCIAAGLVAPPSALPGWIGLGVTAIGAALLGWHLHARRIGRHLDAVRRSLAAGSGQLWHLDLRQGRLWLYGTLAFADRAVHTLDVGRSRGLPPVHPDDMAALQRAFIAHRDGELPSFRCEYRTDLRGDGGWTWLDVRGSIIERDGAGQPLRMAGIARALLQGQVTDTERSIAAEVLQSMSEAVAVLDRQMRFVSVNPAFTRITGYPEAEVIGHPLALLDPPGDGVASSALPAALERDGHWQGECWRQRSDREEILCSERINLVRDNAGHRIFHVLVMEDITERRRAEQELRYLANYDTLTGLPNRALLTERLAMAVTRARASGSRGAVLFLDLDRFKDINDSMGHAFGDRVLRAVAERMRESLGLQHTAARLSGDEFAVVVEDLPDDAEGAAGAAARRLLAAFEAPLQLDATREVAISPSIGISLFPAHAQVPSELLKLADTAMYRAKAVGRRTFQVYSPQMDAGMRERAQLAGALRKIRAEAELRLVYQPRYSLGERRIVGFEALLRWDSPEFGAVTPDRFIPIAEETGLIVPFGAWALQQACQTLRQWHARGQQHLAVSVNVSAIQLAHGNLVATVARVLQDTGIPPHKLELELTESVVMDAARGHAETLHALRRLGVGLAIDDFGTGYSSLAYLKRLPINTLKIDQEFIADLTRDADDEAITSTIIAMGHSLSLKVVAEGVEDGAQLAFLERHGCEEVQGYLISPALEAEACEILLRRPPLQTHAQPIPS